MKVLSCVPDEIIMDGHMYAWDERTKQQIYATPFVGIKHVIKHNSTNMTNDNRQLECLHSYKNNRPIGPYAIISSSLKYSHIM